MLSTLFGSSLYCLSHKSKSVSNCSYISLLFYPPCLALLYIVFITNQNQSVTVPVLACCVIHQLALTEQDAMLSQSSKYVTESVTFILKGSQSCVNYGAENVRNTALIVVMSSNIGHCLWLCLALRQVIQSGAHVRSRHFEKQSKSVIAFPNERILLAGGKIIGYGNNITCT